MSDCQVCVVFLDLQETREEEEILVYLVLRVHLESKEKEDLKVLEDLKDLPAKTVALEILGLLDNLVNQELLE